MSKETQAMRSFPHFTIPRFCFRLGVALVFAFSAGAGKAQVDLTDVEASGSEKLKISVKGHQAIQISDDVTVDIDGADMLELGAPVLIEGDVDDSGKKPLLTITNWSDIEDDIEVLIDAANPDLSPSTVVIDQAAAKTKLAAKAKTDLALKLGVSFPFTVNASYAGKFSVKVAAVERRPPPCADGMYVGLESFKAGVKGEGSTSSKDQVASLDLGDESTPFDGMIDFTYTNNSASPNTTITGMLDYSGKKPVVIIDAMSESAVVENLEALILAEAGASSTVTLGAVKTSFKCGKNGESAAFSYSAAFMADFGILGIGKGKVSIKNKMVAP